MPNIIDNNYFKYDLAIPQAVAQPTITNTTPNRFDEVKDCITVVEQSLLIHALGLTIYRDLQVALPITNDSLPKWKALVNGTEYDGKRWEGLSHEKSLIAYAVYYHYLDENSVFWNALGVEKPESANSQGVSPSFKLATAYQKFLKKYQGGACVYPYRGYLKGAYFEDYYGETEEVIVSLYQFLRDKKEDYGWEQKDFRLYPEKNSFGL